MKTKILIILFITFFSLNVKAQTISPLDIVKPTVKTIPLKPITKEYIDLLNTSLINNDYSKFYETMKLFIKNENYINFLLSKANEGNPLVYWMMADYYSSTSNPKEAHKWYYIAIIMTQQDSALCIDTSARFAAQKTMKNFPEVLTFTRGTPQFTQQAMTEVIFFLENIKQRIDPSWSCSFGENENPQIKNKTIKPHLWKNKRDEILNKFSNSFIK